LYCVLSVRGEKYIIIIVSDVIFSILIFFSKIIQKSDCYLVGYLLKFVLLPC